MKYFYSFFITLLICSNICAQDLIKNTRNGTQYASAKKSAQLNNIAKKVEETFKNTGYMTSKAFALQKNQQQLVAKNSKVVEDAVYFNLNKAEIAKIVQASPNSLKLQIPVTESNSIDLELIKNDFLAEGFEINTIEGEKFKLDENALFYKGIVNGDPSSIAAISIFDGDINGIISDKNGNYNLGSLKNKENQAILFNSKYSKSDKQFSCGGELLDDYYNNQQLKANKTEASAKKAENIACDTNDCVGVYFEVAEDLYDKLGSINAVVQYVTTVFNITSLVFENEQDVNGNSRAMKICLSSMFIWTKDDIYYGPKNIRITQFSKQLYNYDFPGAIAMVLSYIPGFSGGYANTGPFRNLATNNFDADLETGMFKPGLCHDHIIPPDVPGNGFASGPFGSITFALWYETYPQFSRDVYLIAHETGHIFGSPHTHACAWELGGQSFKSIDDCGPDGINGETFYQYTPNSDANAISHDCTFDGTLEGANDPSLMSYCDKASLSIGFGEQPGELMYYNYSYGVENGCFPVENRDDVFDEFTFLDPLVSQTNCSNERISVFREDGNDIYVYVETDGFTRLYNDNGDLLCEEGVNINCICEYDLYEIDDYWACCGVDADPVDRQVLQNCECENDDSIFTDYEFLNNYVDQNNCNGESVTVYNVFFSEKWHYYFYVKLPGQNEQLYYENGGGFMCSGSQCLQTYNLTDADIILKWKCCTGIENQIGGCNDEGACNYEPQADTDDGSCIYTGCNTIVCQGATSTYPWLSDYIKDGTCTKIYNYRKTRFNYLYLRYNNQGFVYLDRFSFGKPWGAGDGVDNGDFSIVTNNNLGDPEDEWRCGCEMNCETISNVYLNVNIDCENACQISYPQNGLNRQYRYSIKNENNWSETTSSISSIASIGDLPDCSIYEFQVREQCGSNENAWSEWSASKEYTIVYNVNYTSINYAINGSDITLFAGTGNDVVQFEYSINGTTYITEQINNNGSFTINNINANDDVCFKVRRWACSNMPACYSDEICVDETGIEPPVDGDTDLFRTYDWLNEIIDTDDCDGETISVYLRNNGTTFLVISDQDLYEENGRVTCRSADCVSLTMGNSVLLDSWSCTTSLDIILSESKTLNSNNDLEKQKVTNSFTANKFNIFPNPATKQVYIQLNDDYRTYNQSIHIFYLTGQKIRQIDIEEENYKSIVAFDFSDAAKGMYLVKWQSKDAFETQKLIIN